MFHTGNVIAEKDGYTIIDCNQCNFVHAFPIPIDTKLDEFYKGKYFDLIKQGGRAPGMGRLFAGDDEAETERDWLRRTLYTDINATLSRIVSEPKKSILDIGCGTGDFLGYMQEDGWNCTGIEPSLQMTAQQTYPNLTIFNMPLNTFISIRPECARSFDVISLINVLEHVPSPRTTMEQIKTLLKPSSGVVVARVPNDFSNYQQFAERKLEKTPWWITLPDHINYFSMKTFRRFLISAGFSILFTTTDFPMEFFLLMGDDYIRNQEIGSLCHKKRRSFELSIPDDSRRNLYQALADLEIGRTCLVFACLPKKECK